MKTLYTTSFIKKARIATIVIIVIVLSILQIGKSQNADNSNKSNQGINLPPDTLIKKNLISTTPASNSNVKTGQKIIVPELKYTEVTKIQRTVKEKENPASIETTVNTDAEIDNVKIPQHEMKIKEENTLPENNNN